MQKKLENKMTDMIDFENLTQMQNNPTLMDMVGNKDMKKLLSTLTEVIGLIESQPDPDFFQNENDVQKK